MRSTLTALLIGRDLRQALLFLGLAPVLYAGTALVLEVLFVLGLSATGPAWLVLLGGVVIIAAGTPAYHNDGLLPSVLLGTAPFAGSRIWHYHSRCGAPCPENIGLFPPYPVDLLTLVAPFVVVGYLAGRLVARTFPEERELDAA